MTASRKGIILAGGNGTRLYPSTKVLSKQLIPIYDKPMIYYPLNTLMQAKVNDILIISTPEHIDLYKNLLGFGDELGIKISYIIQENPNGLAEALLIGEEFIDRDNVALILGDNIFYGETLGTMIDDAWKNNIGASIFGYSVENPNRFGVIELDKYNKVLSIEEKPIRPKSNFAVTGLYIFDINAVDYAKSLTPSARNELEITDLNNIYLKNNTLNVALLGDNYTWLDTGTNESLLEASKFVYKMEKQYSKKIGCIEETALKNNWITIDDLRNILKKNGSGSYKLYLEQVTKYYENNSN